MLGDEISLHFSENFRGFSEGFRGNFKIVWRLSKGHTSVSDHFYLLSEVRVVELGRVATKVICQGTTLKFKCKNSSLAMVIYAATYGRQEDGRTLCPFKEDLVDQSVIQANETDDNSVCSNEKNVTLEIMKLCDKKRRCIVTVNETYFGNPCKGIYKFLKIIYACGEYCITNGNRTVEWNSVCNHTSINKNRPSQSGGPIC